MGQSLPDADGPGAALRLATWNVHKCRGSRGFQPSAVSRAIDALNADVVALQEVDTRFGRDRGKGLLDVHQLTARGLKVVDASVHREGHGWHGNAIVLRVAIAVEEVRRLALPGIEPRGALAVDIRPPGWTVPLRVVAVHLGLLAGCRRAQAKAILAWLRGMPGMPGVLLGDTNEWRSVGSLSGLLTPGHHTGSPGASYPSGLPLLRLDRIIALPGVEIGQRRVIEAADFATASDHLPMVATLHVSI